jgi:hypothetical protein
MKIIFMQLLFTVIAAFFFWSCSAKSDTMRKSETEAERTAAYQQYPDALYPIRKKTNGVT